MSEYLSKHEYTIFLVSFTWDTEEISRKGNKISNRHIFLAQQSASVHVLNGGVSKLLAGLERSAFRLQRSISRHLDNFDQSFLFYLS